MSKQNPKTTVSGKGRTYSDRHPYLKVTFWNSPANHFWEDDHHTPAAKEYFRRNLAVMMSNPHSQVKVLNSQEI